jgi:hypothetical protein
MEVGLSSIVGKGQTRCEAFEILDACVKQVNYLRSLVMQWVVSRVNAKAPQRQGVVRGEVRVAVLAEYLETFSVELSSDDACVLRGTDFHRHPCIPTARSNQMLAQKR